MAMRRLHLFIEHQKTPQVVKADDLSDHDPEKGDERQPFKDEIRQYEAIMSGYSYMLTMDGGSEMCELVFPARMVRFHLDDIYIECPELPILHDGILNMELRGQLEAEGLTLPETPYFPVFRLVAKEE
jgi:hypothetical protein